MLFRSNLEYGPTATIWRINVGLRKRKNPNELGFSIDTENGRWVRPQELIDQEGPDSSDDEIVNRTQTVVPFVEDRRNCLLLRMATPMTDTQMASLQAAFKTAIQAEYQVEDSELASEPLPNSKSRNIIMLYEASEGGAGILRQLVQDPAALRAIAYRALDICHFDSEGEDLDHAPNSEENCISACYDCLMSYSNQLDHALLDRHEIRDLLLQLASSEIGRAHV